jgi:hypothetical protein
MTAIYNTYRRTCGEYTPIELFIMSVLDEISEDHPLIERLARRGVIANYKTDGDEGKERVAALKDGVSAAACPPLGCEAELSSLYDPGKGCRDLEPVKIRPGEKAEVEFRFIGPVKGGKLKFDGGDFALRDLAPGEECVLKMPGAYTGTVPVSFSAATGCCRIGAVKRYLKQIRSGE